MSNRRIAEIHRQIAELHRELAAVLEGAPSNDAEPEPKRPRAKHIEPRGPINEPSEMDRARARSAARRLGHRVGCES